MKFGSLFSGIGGFDLGFERVGMACAWQCEIDDKARAVLARHWPDAERHTDVRAIGASNLSAVDLICGGFPCQDLSVAGKRAGLAGERSGLWFEFHRILSELRPEWVVIENVPGLLSSNGGRDFAVVLRGLGKLGYGVAWRVLDAQYFGVAQRRRRVFIVGSLGSGRAAEVLFEREGSPRDIAPSRQAGTDVADTVGTSADRVSGRQGGLAPALSTKNGRLDPSGEHLAIAWTERTRGKERQFEYQEEVAYALTNPGSGGRPHSRTIAHTLTANYGKQVDSSDTNQGPPNVIVTHTLSAEGHDASEDGTGRGVPLTVFGLATSVTPKFAADVSPTLMQPSPTGGGQPAAVAGNMGVRRLTPVECERLQGFPDGHTDNQADSSRYRQLGNAVAVPVAEWIGRRIMAASAAPTPGHPRPA